MKFWIQLYINNREIILYSQANPYRLKTKNINSLIFISTIIKCNGCFRFIGLGFLRKNRKGLVVF